MQWFHVEDAGEKHVVLILAKNVQDACHVYTRDFPPDLFAKAASAAEISAWLENPRPWSID